MSTPRSISLYDLMQYDVAKKAILNEDKKTLEAVLYSLGLDTNEPYHLDECNHRPLTKKDNEPWYGGRYNGNERQDREWLMSEHCSWENKVDSIRDPELRSELIMMGNQGSADKAFVDEKAGKSAVSSERNKGV